MNLLVDGHCLVYTGWFIQIGTVHLLVDGHCLVYTGWFVQIGTVHLLVGGHSIVYVDWFDSKHSEPPCRRPLYCIHGLVCSDRYSTPCRRPLSCIRRSCPVNTVNLLPLEADCTVFCFSLSAHKISHCNQTFSLRSRTCRKPFFSLVKSFYQSQTELIEILRNGFRLTLNGTVSVVLGGGEWWWCGWGLSTDR